MAIRNGAPSPGGRPSRPAVLRQRVSATATVGPGLERLPTIASLDAGLRRGLAEAARTPRLLVAGDYDGTLAPITADPRSVQPSPEAVSALRSLACLPQPT